MQVTVNGKPRRVWRVRDTMGVHLVKAADEACGEVLSADAASQAHRGSSARESLIQSAFGVALGLAILVPGLMVGKPADRIWIVLTASASAGAVIVAARWRYRRALARWSVGIGERAAALPPVGALVRVDVSGVTSGDRSAPWDRLTLAALELSERSDENSSVTTVDRLIAVSPDGPIALDRQFLSNGAAIVDAAFRKLARERGVGEG